MTIYNTVCVCVCRGRAIRADSGAQPAAAAAGVREQREGAAAGGRRALAFCAAGERLAEGRQPERALPGAFIGDHSLVLVLVLVLVIYLAVVCTRTCDYAPPAGIRFELCATRCATKS